MPDDDRREITTRRAPRPTGRYAQGVASHGFVFLAGQAPFAPDGTLVEGLAAQVHQCLANLQAVAEAADSTLADAVRVGVYLSPRADAGEYNRAFTAWFADLQPPARTTIRSDFKEFDVEIDAIVLAPDGR